MAKMRKKKIARVFESPCPTVKVCVSMTNGENTEQASAKTPRRTMVRVRMLEANL